MKRFVKASEEVIKIPSRRISPEMIAHAESTLIDNGIDEDEASIVLQAIGYELLDTELYPE